MSQTRLIRKIIRAIKPYVAGWITEQSKSVIIGGSFAAPSPHDLDGMHHTGYLTPALGYILRIRGNTVKVFSGDNAGLASANGGATTNDVILIPPVEFTADLIIADGIKVVGWSRWATVFSGEITGGAGASLENLSVSRSESSGSDIAAILAPASGIFKFQNCDIECVNSGAGNAYGISCAVAGSIIMAWNSYIYGESATGKGYGTYRDTALSCAIHIFGGHVWGSTTPCNE